MAVLVATAAAYFAGLGGVVRVVRAVFDFLGDVAQALRAWLAKPGNKMRGLCAVFAFGFLAAGLQSWQRGTVIVQQRADYTALKEKTDAERADLQGRISERDRRIAQFIEYAEAQKRLLAQLQEQSAAAAAEAEKQRERAALSEAKYQEAFNARPPECEAALQVMAKACPTLKDY